VPLSIVLHVVVLGAAVIAPLMAVGSLPPPRPPLSYHVTEVVLPKLPPLGVPGRRAGASSSTSPAVAQPAPTAAPATLPTRDLPDTGPAPDPIGVPAGGLGVANGIEGGLDSYGAAQPPVAPPSAAPLAVGGRIRAPQKIHDVPPVYPAIAVQARIEGLVILEAVIGPDGHVRDLRVLRSVALLDQAALDAVRQWTFTPTLLNGEPVAVAMTITVQFRLSR
jgi:protein TonB